MKILDKIIRRLDVITKLLSFNSIRDKPANEQTIFLYNISLEIGNIAKLLGNSRTHISKENYFV